MVANAPAGSTLSFSEGTVSEKLSVDKNLTLQGTTKEGQVTALEQGITLAVNENPISLVVKDMTIENGEFGIFTNNNGPTANAARNASIVLEDCVIKDFTGKGVYAADAYIFKMKNCVVENCATGTDTGTAGDYAVDLNLIGVKGVTVAIEDCEFKGYAGAKSAVKVTMRGGPSDQGAGDIPMDKGQATISNFTVTGCSFDTETPVDVRLGTEHKTPDQPDLENTTANFPVMISGNKTEINVLVAPTGESYVVPVGGIGYKNSTGEFTVISGTTPDPDPDPDPEEPTTGASIGDVDYTTIAEAVAALKDGDTLVFNQDYDQPIIIDGVDVTINLNGHTIANTAPVFDPAGGIISLIAVENGANVTITGNGTIHALEDDCYCVDVQNGSMLTIEDGTFIGNITACYVQQGDLVIEGGDYSIQQLSGPGNGDDERFTLNCLDANYKDGTATIEVTGGTFNKFDPANNLAEGPGTNFCAAGYTTEQQGDKYTVVKA